MRINTVVVGARCAGAATAMLLARAGARVLMVDKGVYGSDTTSTHALMRGAILQLHRWGVLPTIIAAGRRVLTTFRYPAGRHRSIEPRSAWRVVAARRALLDRTLVVPR